MYGSEGSERMDTSGGDARWSTGGYGSMDHRQHQQSYAPYTPPEPRRSIPGMQAFDWSSPATTPNLRHDAHGEQHRTMPRISRLSSHPGPGMYSSHTGSSYPNSSSEELASVAQGGSADYGYHHQQQQHHPTTHHQPQSSQHHYHSHHHQQQHHQSSAPTTPQYHSMYSAFGAPSPTLNRMGSNSSLSGIGAGTAGPSVPGPSAMTGVHMTATNADLADLGIASRDSRLDEKWTMFMSQSGILEPGFRG